MKRRINLSFGQYSDADFENKANHIVDSITENKDVFDQPSPAVAELQAAAARYSKALLAAANRGRKEVSEKNAARKSLIEMLIKLGMYVMNIADGDETTLVQSGFTLTKLRELRHIAIPGNVSVVNGITSGQLIVFVKADKSARVYVHEITDNFAGEATIWKSISTANTKCIYDNLTPGRQYWFRIGIGGARNQFGYSPVASRFVQ